MSPLKEFGVGLLIGYDCPEALVPRRVITGGKGEPYAVQTDLGWGVVGGKQQIANSRQVTGLCHRISVQELPAVSSAAVIKILESDFADISSKEIPSESHTELSMGDPEVKIVQTLSTAAKCQDDILERLARCSKWNTVIKVVARIQRLAKGIRKKESLNVEERMKAEETVIRLIQQRFYSEELM